MKFLLVLFRIALFVIAVALLAAVGVWRVAHSMPDHEGWVVIGYVAAPWVSAIALAIAVFGLIARAPAVLIPAAVAAVIAIAPFGRALLPKTVALEIPGDRIKVLSLNTSAQSSPGYVPSDAARLAMLIIREQPDIVLLQELSQWEWPALQAQLRTHSEGQGYAGLVTKDNDVTVVSRHPMRQVPAPKFETSVNHAIVELPGGSVHVWSVHTWRDGFLPGKNLLSYDVDPLLGRPDLKAQIDWIARQAGAASGPVIVAGDFNAPMASPLLQPMYARFREVQFEAGAGMGFSFPNNAEYTRYQRFRGRTYALSSPFPLTRIDHIFASQSITVMSARVGNEPVGSDHSYIMAELIIPAR